MGRPLSKRRSMPLLGMRSVKRGFCKIRVLLLGIIPFLQGCQSHGLFSYSYLFNRESLASYSIKTPDPQLNFPPLEQRIFIRWNLPASFLNNSPLILKLTILFHNHTEETVSFEIKKERGSLLYKIEKGDFCEKEGVLTYKTELFYQNTLLYQWHHRLWTDLILLEGALEQDESSSFSPVGNASESVEILL